MLIDSHAHMDDKRFDKDRKEILSNLRKDGIEAIINIGADIKTSEASVQLAKDYDNIYATVGVHPHDVKDLIPSDIDRLRELSMEDKVVAIGEIGLDYYYDHSPRELQSKWFEEQILLAKERNLPIVIHSRDAAKDTLDMIKKHADGLRGVMHCFSYGVEIMREYLAMDFYIALGGAVTFKNARVPVEVAKIVPINRLILETDAPYLTPEPYRGRRNEPKNTKYVAERVAEIKGVSVHDLSVATTANVKELFL